MCGRYELRTTGKALAKCFDIPKLDLQIERYNISPSLDVPIIRLNDNSRELVDARWGLVPFWSKGINSKYSTTNAKCETMAKLSSYREPYKKRRCLIPATGYYEWRTEDGKKQPYHIFLGSDLFAFAGLWDHWKGDDEEITSATIVTAVASNLIKWVHPRMPVILKREHYADWLNTDESHPMFSIVDLPALDYETVPVSTYVNSPRNQGPKCIEPIGGHNPR